MATPASIIRLKLSQAQILKSLALPMIIKQSRFLFWNNLLLNLTLHFLSQNDFPFLSADLIFPHSAHAKIIFSIVASLIIMWAYRWIELLKKISNASPKEK